MRGQATTHLADEFVNGPRLNHLENIAATERFLGRDRVGEEQEALDSGWAEDGDQSRSVCQGQAIAQGAGDRYTEGRRRRSDPKVASGGNYQASTHGCAFDNGNRRYWQILDCAGHCFDALFVGNSVLCRGKAQEFADVSTGGERSSNSTERRHSYVRIGGDASGRSTTIDAMPSTVVQ